jgi:hypothetical protein
MDGGHRQEWRMPGQLVTGSFGTRNDGAAALSALLRHGFQAEDISIVLSARARQKAVALRTSAATTTDLDAFVASASEAIAGVYATGPLTIALRDAAAGRAAGLLDGLMRVGMSEREARRVCRTVAKGGILVAVRTTREGSPVARDIFGHAPGAGGALEGRARGPEPPSVAQSDD